MTKSMGPSLDQPTLDTRRCVVAVTALGVLMIAALALMGRLWWCEAGDWQPWSWDVWSEHNSQHLLDPYSLSHVQHGIGFLLLLSLFARHWLSMETRTLIVAIVEAGWELAENTPIMIDRYREATISLDYYGDSILNSASDYMMCLLGVMIARKMSWPWSLAIFFALEAISILWIRDSLLLNILMLLYPIDAVKNWQAAASA